MRKRSILGILALVIIISPSRSLQAFNYEVHPGIMTSYEYTDNYRGDVSHPESENIYYLGPTLDLRATSPELNFNFVGDYSKSFHKKFSEDDSPIIHAATHASYTSLKQGATLDYEFSRSLSRDDPSEPFGELLRHAGGVGYSRSLSQGTNLTAGYTMAYSNWNVSSDIVSLLDHEDIATQGGNISINHQLNQKDSVTLRGLYNFNRYEISQNVSETTLGLDFSHMYSPLLTLTLGTSYYTNNHQSASQRYILLGGVEYSDETRYDASLSGRYALSQSMSMNLTGGYTWLVMEQEDRQSGYLASFGLDKSIDENLFHLLLSRGYTAQFTTSRYGIYNTYSSALTWQRRWLRDWSTNANISWMRTKPTTQTQEEEESDTIGIVSLRWEPIEHFSSSIEYDHFIRKFTPSNDADLSQTSGNSRENRYRFVLEVRY